IRPCIGTLQDCWGRSVAREWPMHCTVNPIVGREGERASLKPTEKSKKILIIGSGPAGLEAARVAAERGHKVVIYEKRGAIGGQVNLGGTLPGRADIRSIVKWYEGQLKRLGVRIDLNKEVTPDREVAEFVVSEEGSEALIIATGSVPVPDGMQMMTFREVDGWNKSKNVHTIEVLESKKKLNGCVVVADSTTYIEGVGIAEWLARNGSSHVVLVTPHSHPAPELANYNQLVYVSRRIDEAGIEVKTLSWIQGIDDSQAIIYNIPSGRKELISCNHVVLNTGRKQAGRGLKEAFQGLVGEIYEIGDCNIAGGRMGGAINSGFLVAYKI
ncbi:MAG: FAD-dependent oxidoreductase, partial [Nitrososphaerales archaeon]